MLANETCILTDLSKDPREFGYRVVEAKLEHSKTGFSRYLDMAGETLTSQIEVANFFLDYWKRAGFKVNTTMQAGIRVQRPDFWVLRVSMLGMNEARMEKLVQSARRCGIGPIEYGMSKLGTEKYIRTRYAARGASSQLKKYVNLMGGASDNADLRHGLSLFRSMGFEASLTPGPLLLATSGGRYAKVTAMPLATSSAFGPTKELLTRAHEKATADPADPDPDLDLRPGDLPKWTTHSLRRMANTSAQRFKEITEVTSDEIDIFFGWQERVLLKAMQVHYAQMTIRERMNKAKITCMI